jgi:hypothetical protein
VTVSATWAGFGDAANEATGARLAGAEAPGDVPGTGLPRPGGDVPLMCSVILARAVAPRLSVTVRSIGTSTSWELTDVT